MGPRCHICVILVLVATRVPYLCPLAKVVPFSEIFMDPSDPKHVAKLLKGSDGPGVVDTTRTHRWGAFLTTQRKSLIRSGRTSRYDVDISSGSSCPEAGVAVQGGAAVHVRVRRRRRRGGRENDSAER